MGWKKVSTDAVDIKKHLNKPFIGEYKGQHKITTKIGEQTVYNFITPQAVPFAVYGFTNLNRIMNNVEVGTVCKITYKGTEKVQTKFGLKDVHQVDVEVSDGDITEEQKDNPEEEQDLPF